MHAPKWKLFTALWIATVALWILPYVIERFGNLDVKDAFTGYPWNFSPFYAVSLFGGAYLANRFVAIVLPVAAYAAMNLVLVSISGKPSWATEPEVWFNYACLAMFPIFGLGLQKSDAPLGPALGRSFAASIVFFLLSNLAVYFVAYPRTLAGLVDCYFMALPFFPATVGSAVFFTAVLFSTFAPKMATQPVLK